VEGNYSRAVFISDYRDSDLFHVLEDTLRKHNAKVLGLIAACSPRPATVSGSQGTQQPSAAAGASGEDTSAAATARSGIAVASTRKMGGASAAGLRGASVQPPIESQSTMGAKGSHSRAGQKPAAGALVTPKQAAAAASVKRAGANPEALARATSMSPSERNFSPGAAGTDEHGHVKPALLGTSVPGGQLPAGGTAKALPRAHFADSEFDYWSECSGSDEDLTECDLRLQEVLAPYKGVVLDNKLLQVGRLLRSECY
jgi:hypothetical protein